MKQVAVVVALLMGLLSSSSAATLQQYLVSQHYLSDLLQTAGLWDTLSTGGPYTLFVPQDVYLVRYLASQHTSVNQLKQDPTALAQFLKYHIVNGTIPRDQLYNERKLKTLSGGTIRINDYVGLLTAQGVYIRSTTVASNGVIHWLYNPMDAANGTVADIVSSQPDLSTLYQAVQTAGLIEFMNDQNPITLFAPTNQAFQSLGQDKVNALLHNPQLLMQILEYHVIPGTLYSTGITGSLDLHTFEETDKLHLQNLGSYFNIDNGHAVRTGEDMSATNGVVHKIDHVLIPASLASQIP